MSPVELCCDSYFDLCVMMEQLEFRIFYNTKLLIQMSIIKPQHQSGAEVACRRKSAQLVCWLEGKKAQGFLGLNPDLRFHNTACLEQVHFFIVRDITKRVGVVSQE
jgi:hypothetical protein